MITDIIYGKEARSEILEGAEKVAKAVIVTLGGKGKNVVIQGKQKADLPRTTKDGVTVARAIRLWDNPTDQGAHLLQEVAEKTNTDAGDGTTTSILLAYELIKQGLKTIDEGANPALVAKGMRAAGERFVKELENVRIEVSEETIKDVAAVSANNDKELGELIGETLWNVGSKGTVIVEGGGNYASEVEYTTGNVLETGLAHPDFGFDKGRFIAENPYVFISDLKLEKLGDIRPVLEIALRENRPLVLIGGSLGGEAMKTVVKNFIERNLLVCYMDAPYTGVMRLHAMSDLAKNLGGTYFNEAMGTSVHDIGISDVKLGECSRVVIDTERAKFIGGNGDKQVITKHIKELNDEIDECKDDLKKQAIKERLSRLQGKVATIKVGGTTKIEIQEKKDRVEDAVNASRAALDEGIIAGGGIAYLYGSDWINKNMLAKMDMELDFRKGVSIVSQALEKPYEQILVNAMIENTDKYYKKVIKQIESLTLGYDVVGEEFVDMLQKGIVDPVKVVRVCIENSISLASLFMTTEALIYHQQ